MFDSEFYFLLPPAVPQEVPWPEAFDRSFGQAPTLGKRKAQRAPQTASALVAEFLSDVQNERDLSAPSRRLLQADLESYWRWLQAQGIVKWRHVSAAQVEKYAHDLRSGQAPDFTRRKRPALQAKFLAPSTLARKLAAVREWHRFLARRYKWPDVAAHLTEAPLNSSASLALSAAQIKELLALPELSSVPGMRDYAILCLLCEGFSPQEISALRHEERFEESATLSVLGETARRAIQAYNERARPLLVARLRKKGLYSRRTFFSNRSTPLSPLLIQQMVRRYVALAQLPSWVSASHLYKAGAARRARGASLEEESILEMAALPRAAQLRQAHAKAHPRA